MKRVVLCLVIGGVLAAITLCAAAASPGSAGDAPEIEQLKKQVEALSRRVESLEKRMKDSQTIVLPRNRMLPPIPVDPNSLPGPRSTPRDWRRFEFNGMPYYIVPIGGAHPEPGKPQP